MAVRDVAYVIAEFDEQNQPTGYVKVGKTTEAQVDTRLSKLQTGNPRRLKFLLRYVAQRPFEVESIMSRLQRHNRIILPPSPADQLTPDNYAERKTEWYRIESEAALRQFLRDFQTAMEEAR